MIAAIFILSGFATLIYQVAWQRALFSIYGLECAIGRRRGDGLHAGAGRRQLGRRPLPPASC